MNRICWSVCIALFGFAPATSIAQPLDYLPSISKGDITIRIPGDSAFRLVAASPARRIKLNDFWNDNFKAQDGRRLVGDVGDGRSSVSVTNFSGQITFMRR